MSRGEVPASAGRVALREPHQRRLQLVALPASVPERALKAIAGVDVGAMDHHQGWKIRAPRAKLPTGCHRRQRAR
jgi:hypothetical protein